MTTNTSFTVLYFAQLADEAKTDRETLSARYDSLESLYQHLQGKYHFSLRKDQLRVAVNQEFASWEISPKAGDEIAFIPPVAGG